MARAQSVRGSTARRARATTVRSQKAQDVRLSEATVANLEKSGADPRLVEAAKDRLRK